MLGWKLPSNHTKSRPKHHKKNRKSACDFSNIAMFGNENTHSRKITILLTWLSHPLLEPSGECLIEHAGHSQFGQMKLHNFFKGPLNITFFFSNEDTYCKTLRFWMSQFLAMRMPLMRGFTMTYMYVYDYQ